MWLPVLLCILGLAVLIWAADLTVDAGASLAGRFGVSSLLVGLTITSVGTSLPEIATNVAAGLSGRMGSDASGVAVGNVLGSNLALVTLLLGVTALRVPFRVPSQVIRRDGPVALSALAAMAILAFDGGISAIDGMILVGAYVVYITALIWDQRRSGQVEASPAEVAQDTASEATEAPVSPWRDPLRLAGGLAAVMISAHLMVTNGLIIAEALHVPAVLVGILVGVGTNMPELAVSVRAAGKDADLALGNLLGSATANPLVALGSGALVFPVTVPPGLLSFDWTFTFISTLIALLLIRNDRQLSRLEAGVLLLLFFLYTWVRVVVLT